MGKRKTASNGEGSLYYSNTLDKWIYQYFYDGVRKTVKQKNSETDTAFKKRVTALKNSLNNNTYIQKSKDTLQQIIERYINQKKIDGIISGISYKRNLDTLEQLKKCTKDYIDKPIQKISVEEIEDSKIYMSKYSQSCINKMWGFLNKGFEIAYARRKISFNIMLDPVLSKPISQNSTKKIEALTIEEQNKLNYLLDTTLRNHKYRNIVKLELLTGMRIGELLARSVSDYDKAAGTLKISSTLTKNENDIVVLGNHTKTYNLKTKQDSGVRILNLPLEAQKIIEEELYKNISNIHNLIFWDYKNNRFISGSEINSWLDRINQKYKITPNKLHNHVLRHTRITRWREAGVDMAVIQYWAGHVEKSNITEAVYFSLTPEFIQSELEKYLKVLN